MLSERFSTAVTPAMASGYAVTLQWLKILAHALSKTRGNPWSFRQLRQRRIGVMMPANGSLHYAHIFWNHLIPKGIETKLLSHE